ncbi:DUF3486 family protein [Methylogaea oryzae]|uniref:DUF3486 family protein n=3 Tax=Methylogaea oryzae TaxID=1295382 RepID=A0A8D4VLF7_9GAMM|nr:DUF3486 family protein [Methylogaea oryzae]BBL69741.1 hypothetical protein MoryE10_03470 [Methylogaea oryzae]
MAPRSKVKQLPAAVLAWLESALVEGNFAGYEALEAELKKRGFQISRSAIHRHGQAMERRLAAVRASTDAARLIAEAAPDDADQRSAAVISLVQTDIFNVLLMLQEAETANPEERLLLMGKAAKGIADLSRASLSQKKHEQDIRRQVAAEAAEKVEKIAKRGGMSRETVEAIKAEILGVARA